MAEGEPCEIFLQELDMPDIPLVPAILTAAAFVLTAAGRIWKKKEKDGWPGILAIPFFCAALVSALVCGASLKEVLCLTLALLFLTWAEVPHREKGGGS